LLKITVLFAAIITLAPHGPVWSCAAVSVAFFAHAVVTALMVHSLDGISLRRLVLEIGPPALACVPMVAAVKGVQQLFGGPSVVALLLEVLVGVAVFVPAGLLLAPRVSRDLLRLLLQVLRRRR